MTDVAERLRAAGLAVKPLEWAENQASTPCFLARVPWGNYFVQFDPETDGWFAAFEIGDFEPPDILLPSDVPTSDEAKAAAQAHYEAPILAALCSTLERSAHTPPEQGLGPDEAETRSDTGRRW
jgi:hypothetical protein